MTSDSLSVARYRSGQLTLPNQERDHRLHRTGRTVSEPPFSAADYNDRCRRHGYLDGRCVAAFVEVRLFWDKNLVRSTTWAL